MFFKLFILRLRLLFMSYPKYRIEFYRACNNNDILTLRALVRSRHLYKYSQRNNVAEKLFDAIQVNNITVVRTIVENSSFLYHYTYYNDNFIRDSISKGYFDLFKIFIENIPNGSGDLRRFLMDSIKYFNISNDRKKIFDYLYDKVDDIERNDFVILKDTIAYKNEYAFDKLLLKDCVKRNDSKLKSVFSYCIKNNELNYLTKLINLNQINLSYSNNLLLRLSIEDMRADVRDNKISLFLLDQPSVISGDKSYSFYLCMNSCISEHERPRNNKIEVIKKLLEYIDISFENNVFLINALYSEKEDIIDLFLNNKRIKLDEDNEQFQVINELNSKILMKLVNIPSFRKHLLPEKELFIKPEYKSKKTIRTIDYE